MRVYLLTCALIVTVFTIPAAAAEPSSSSAREQTREKVKERVEERKSEGAGTAAASKSTEGTARRDLTLSGVKRTYLLHTPKDRPTGKPLPLVIVLHGALANGLVTEALTNFDAVADKHTFYAVYPDGLGSVWNFWDDGKSRFTPGKETGDVAFMAKLIDTLVDEKLVDPKRVYATGISNGAFMSNNLGVTLNDKIAAIAPVAGSIPKVLADAVKPTRPIPVLTIHGTNDKLVGADGTDPITKTQTCLSAADMPAWWAKHNSCDATPKTTDLPSKAKDGTSVKVHTYGGSKAAAPVIYYEVVGGGHTWPGGRFMPEFLLGKTSQQFNASEVIWEFFSQHELKASAP